MVADTASAKPVNASTVTHVEYKALFLIQSGILFYVHTGTTLWLVTFGVLIDSSNDDDIVSMHHEQRCIETRTISSIAL